MDTFGYNILRALVTDIVPDAKVKAAMNDINAAQREQIAAQARGEADKILKVKQAEAEAESKALQGDGVARQRAGHHQGSAGLGRSNSNAPSKAQPRSDVMAMVLITQYFDTLREVGVFRQVGHDSAAQLARHGQRPDDANYGRLPGDETTVRARKPSQPIKQKSL